MGVAGLALGLYGFWDAAFTDPDTGLGPISACGLTGIEFLFFVGWVLRRKNKKRSI
jgi:hypothetical protein